MKKSKGVGEMWMSLLYSNDTLIAAAPACDQMPLGESYWYDVHQGTVPQTGELEVAYVNVHDHLLRQDLLSLGVDESLDGSWLEQQIRTASSPEVLPSRAA